MLSPQLQCTYYLTVCLLSTYYVQVLSSQLQWIPQGEQAERFRDHPIRPVHDDILLAKLKPGQEIELEAWCEKGVRCHLVITPKVS